VMIKTTPSSCHRPSRSPNRTSPATSGIAAQQEAADAVGHRRRQSQRARHAQRPRLVRQPQPQDSAQW
jgi:hypothetical protein